MSIDEYLEQSEVTLKKLEELQEFEVCAMMRDLLNAIRNKDVKTFIDLEFDKKALIKCGFFPKRATYEQIEERINTYFGYESIFEYALQETMWCKFYRYSKGQYDIIEKVNIQ
ncbi:hypothetical protein GCM10028807_09710 [Spirosoma daeguense]